MEMGGKKICSVQFDNGTERYNFYSFPVGKKNNFNKGHYSQFSHGTPRVTIGRESFLLSKQLVIGPRPWKYSSILTLIHLFTDDFAALCWALVFFSDS
jgi:hypothetical protein